jgi:hypothetical protein
MNIHYTNENEMLEYLETNEWKIVGPCSMLLNETPSLTDHFHVLTFARYYDASLHYRPSFRVVMSSGFWIR